MMCGTLLLASARWGSGNCNSSPPKSAIFNGSHRYLIPSCQFFWGSSVPSHWPQLGTVFPAYEAPAVSDVTFPTAQEPPSCLGRDEVCICDVA